MACVLSVELAIPPSTSVVNPLPTNNTSKQWDWIEYGQLKAGETRLHYKTARPLLQNIFSKHANKFHSSSNNAHSRWKALSQMLQFKSLTGVSDSVYEQTSA